MIHTFNYNDGSQISIEIDLATKAVYLSRNKAGNVKRWNMKKYGPFLPTDSVFVEYHQTHEDAEGDNLDNSNLGRSHDVYDPDYFQDLIRYTNQGGILGQTQLCIDTLLKNKLAQTRVFDVDGNFVPPVYFKLDGTAPDNDPTFNNGTVTATILEANGYADLEVRFRITGGNWQAWEPLNAPVVKSGLSSNTYEAQVRSAGTPLMIEPTEIITI